MSRRLSSSSRQMNFFICRFSLFGPPPFSATRSLTLLLLLPTYVILIFVWPAYEVFNLRA